MHFHFRPFSDKPNDLIFFKSLKTLLWAVFWPSLLLFLSQKNFSKKLGSVTWAPMIITSCTIFKWRLCPLQVCLIYLKESWNKEKNYFALKALFVLELPNFNFWDIEMSWHHQMPKHETRNIFYWKNWEVNTVW